MESSSVAPLLITLRPVGLLERPAGGQCLTLPHALIELDRACRSDQFPPHDENGTTEGIPLYLKGVESGPVINGIDPMPRDRRQHGSSSDTALPMIGG
jgi:hypothetical protein